VQVGGVVVDEEFAGFVASRYVPLVKRAYLLTGDRGAAEDLVQDVLAGLLIHWRRGRPDDPDRYVARAVTNRAISRWRRGWRAEVPVESVRDLPGPDVMHGLADRDLLWRGLGTLPSRQRAVLVLRYFEQLSDAEIADEIGVAHATVRSLAGRGLHRLREDESLRSGLEGVL
jgi:RNA polymerase sigma-70 factor, ECF subfamily